MPELNSLAEGQLDGTHYLKSVTQMGDVVPVVANQDVHAASGMKLISAGMRINSSLYERLLNHRLVPSIDECLTAENAVSGAGLAKIARQMLQEDKRLGLIQSAHSFGQSLPDILKHVLLNPAIAFKLTVMREMQPELFRRSVFVSLVSTYIGIQMHMSKNQLIDLATAALLHDIGLLHIDPKLLERDYRMSEAERRHLYVHTVTGCLILKAYPEYRQTVQDAVLQHHERLDGSGYPRGLKSGEIGQFGMIVAVAEIIASRYGSANAHESGSRLETMLKLNMRRYGEDIVRHLKVFYQDKGEVSPCSDADKLAAQKQMSLISMAFQSWDKVLDGGDSVYKFIDERMMNLKMEIVDAGLYLDAGDMNRLGIEDDSHACFEVMTLLDETVWQLRDLLLETKRRWPGLREEGQAGGSAAINSWVSAVEAML